MSDIDKLFGDNKDQQLADVTGEDALKHLVGEGQKYATVEELAKATLHSQLHITKIEQDNAALRESTDKAKGIDDILAALKGNSTTTDDGNPPPADQQKPGDSDDVDVAALIAAEFQKRDQGKVQQTESTNLQSTVDKLAELYGDTALDVFNETGKSLGVDLEALAKKSPAAVLKLVSDARPASQTSGLPNSTHTNSTNQLAGGVMNHETIGKLFKEGKLSRYQKIELENKKLTELGADVFFNRK